MLRAAKILTTKKRQPRRRPLSSSIQSSSFSIRHMQANGTSSVSLQPPTAFAWEHAASRRVDDSTNLAEHRTTAATTFFRAETSFHIGDGLVPPPEYSIRRFNESNGTSAGFYLVHPSGHLPIRSLRHPSARLTVQPVQSRNQQETKAGRPYLGIGQKRSRGSEMATVEVTFTFQKNSSTKISLSVVVIDSVGVDEIPRKEKSPCGDSSLFKIKENKTSLASAANLTTLASPRTMGAGVPSVSTKPLDGLFNLSASFTTTTYTI